MALNQCPMKVQSLKQCFQNPNQKLCLGRMFLERLLGLGGQPRPCAFSSQKLPRTLEWNKIWKGFFIFFCCFKLKKETRRKIINVSKLALRNFNYVSGKHMNIPCFFIFVLFSMKAKTFRADICRKKRFQFVKKLSFSCSTD